MTVLTGYLLDASPAKKIQNQQEIEYFDLTFQYVELTAS